MAEKTDMNVLSYRQMLTDFEYQFFFDLIANNLEITDLPEDVPTSYVIRQLIDFGRVAVTEQDLWLGAMIGGELEYTGVPKAVTTTTMNGNHVMTIETSKLKALIRLRPSARPLKEWLWNECEGLAYIKLAKMNNLIECSSTALYSTDDPKVVKSLKEAYKKKGIGEPVIVCSEKLSGMLKNVAPTPNYIADKLNELYNEDKNKILKKLGILTANSDKRERVQVGEINASLGETVDNIYTFIETFNEDAKRCGIPNRMKLKGTLETLYANTQYTEENENKEKVGDEDAE